MDYAVETNEPSAAFINSHFVKKITSGHIKEAADESSAFIRSKLRQESAVREIIVPVGVSEEDLDRDENTDQPKIIVEKEPDSEAIFLPFQGTGRRRWFRGPRYAIYFGKIESDRFTKSKFELMTNRSDIRKILSDNSVKDMADQEDGKFADLIAAIVALNADQQSGGPFQSSTFKQAMQRMLNREIPVGKMLLTKSRYLDAIDLPATTVGDDIAKRHFDEGIEASQKLWGIPVVTTIKSSIYNNDRAWVFAPQAPNNFLGNFYLLQDATLFIQQKADIIEFWSYEALGLGIGNRLSIQQITFV